jgi:hypothetical protein
VSRHITRSLNGPGLHIGLCSIVALTLALALTACDSSVPRVPYAPTVTLTVTPHPTVLPASTEGWAIYTDQRFHFQAPIPPGWKAKAYTAPWDCPQGGESDYIVGFFPPDMYPDAPGTIPTEYPFGKIHEFIDIYLPLCSSSQEAPLNPYHITPEPGGILIGATHAPYYVHDNTDWISRYTNADFGGQTYIFDIEVTPQDKGLRDVPLFHGMLAGFEYLG